ncbi:hypothetical protein EG329_011473 [Mollisiaceae sp. DMI_Dod_QoI]|nr:hypothetical protein EG329_011473 [Helotiales sp. DMI_Dod_QoI]
MKVTLLLNSAIFASTILSQSIFINLVHSYSSLPCCAQVPLSQVVRDMVSGCGDSNALTSYNCFCSSSSSHFNSIISSAVNSGCGQNTTDAAFAGEVFDNYCAIGPTGTQAKITHTTSIVACTASAKPAGVATKSPAVPTSTKSNTTMTTPPPANTSQMLNTGGYISLDGTVLIEGIVLVVAYAFL